MRLTSSLLAAVVLFGSARAQTLFRADLDGAQEVPPVSTNAGGYARFVLNSNDTLTYDVRTWLVNGTAAHIHVGAVGVGGGILFTLSGGPDVWSGTTAALSAADKANLRASGLYVNVHSAAFSSGEIRGQIVPRPTVFGSHLTGDQEVPSNGSSATGDATFVVNPNLTITYNVTTSGITATAAHIHVGAFGVGSGPILFGLSGGPTTWSGTTPAMSATDFDNMQASGLYVNVHSAAFPAGEIRGQIVPTEIPYGVGCPSSAGIPTLHASGGAMRGGTVTLDVQGGVASGSGLLIFSLTDGVATLKHCPYLLGTPLLIVPLTLDGAGDFSAAGAIPDLSASLDVYFQFFGFEPAGPFGNLYASNGLLIPFFDY